MSLFTRIGYYRKKENYRKEKVMEVVRTLKARIVLNNNDDYSKLMDTWFV